jgi:hypothetical protein
MVCIVQGIFYIHDYIRPKLICSHVDEANTTIKISMQHWQDMTDDDDTNPFPAIFPPMYYGSIYFITGYFAIKDDDFANPLVLTTSY